MRNNVASSTIKLKLTPVPYEQCAPPKIATNSEVPLTWFACPMNYSQAIEMLLEFPVWGTTLKKREAVGSIG
jgi:hypothetical protein